MTVRAAEAISVAGLTMGDTPITDECLRVGCPACLEISRLSECEVAWRVVGKFGHSHLQTHYLCACGELVLIVGPRFEFTEGMQFGDWMVVPVGWMEIEPPL